MIRYLTHRKNRQGAEVRRWFLQDLRLLAFLLVAASAFASYLRVEELTQERTRANRAAIVRSCEVLNSAIRVATAGGQDKATLILIKSILDQGGPGVERRYRLALAERSEAPALKPIDCERVARDPEYDPFK